MADPNYFPIEVETEEKVELIKYPFPFILFFLFFGKYVVYICFNFLFKTLSLWEVCIQDTPQI